MLLCWRRCRNVCTLMRRVVSACEWGGMLAGTLVYRQDPDLVGQNVRSRNVGPLALVGSGALLALFCC